MQTSTKVTLGTALIGVAVSVALVVAAVLTHGAGDEHGPGFTTSSIIFAVLFFVLNPLQFLFVLVLESRIPGLLFWTIAVTMNLGWWLMIGTVIGFWFKRRKSGAIKSSDPGAQREPSAAFRSVAMMVTFFLVIPVLVLIAAIALMPTKDMPVSCVILKSGIVSSTLVRSEPNPDTSSGFLNFVDDFRIVEETLRVPVRKDIEFGFEYRFPNLPIGAKVRQVINHPKMVKPDGSVATGSTREKEPGPSFSYALNHDYEMMPGDWRFEYWYGGKRLCEQTFQLYRE